MQLDDQKWIEKWSKVKFSPRPRDFEAAVRKQAQSKGFAMFGSDQEPLSSLWVASLSEAMGETFRDGMTILDYGCGAGRFAQFLRQRLSTFRYYGLEKPGSASQHGEKAIKVARRLFRWDRRIKCDLIGSHLESEAIAQAEVAVLGSILTHTDLAELQNILGKFQPIVARGGKVIFSIFLADEYRLEGPGEYGFEHCYARSWFTDEQLRTVCAEKGWSAAEKESFFAQKTNVHRIFALTSKTRPDHSKLPA